MFKFLRKYNKIILVVGGVLLMITFLIPEAIQRLGQSAGQSGASFASVGDGESVSAVTLDNLRRDPRVTLSFQAHESGGERLHPYLVISGRAEITPGGALDVMDRLAEYYIGPGEQYPWRDPPEGFTVHVDVDRVYGQGSWRADDESAEDA